MRDKRLLIVGASGHGRVVIEIARAAGYDPWVVIDDNSELKGCNFAGVPVVGGRDQLGRLREKGCSLAIVAIGANPARIELSTLLEAYGFSFPVLAHPQACVSPSAIIGEGSVVMPGAVINALAVIGRHVIINTCASIDHDCFVGDFAHIAPGVNLCGSVRVGAASIIGVGACAIPRVQIGARAIIGGGAVVTTDIPENVVAVGVPAVFFGKKVV